MIRVNLNDHVRFALTPEGAVMWHKTHPERFDADRNQWVPADPPAALIPVECPLWCLIRAVGQHIRMGKPPPIVDNTFTITAEDTPMTSPEDLIRTKAVPTDDLVTMLAAHYNRGHIPATDLPADLAFHLRIELEQSAEHYQIIRDLCTRYSLTLAPTDTLAKRLVAHLAQMERDAAEAHSAAKALGVEVKDLADRAKQMTQGSTDLEQRQRLIHVLAEQMANIRRRLAVPVNESVMIHLDDLLSQRDLFQANAVNALDRLAKVEAKLQAINEALPADLRHSDDLAAAVRLLVLSAETRYYQWSELARDTAPAVQTVAALRYALESRPMRLALARELYDADDNLLELLETTNTHQMTEALLATLATNRAAPTYPPLPRPSALALTLEGPAKVAYFNHSRRAGRIEAIGDDLIRFYPVEGDPVTLNATRRDLEVYHLTADELATEIARVEARKTSPATTPPDAPVPDVADDDLPF